MKLTGGQALAQQLVREGITDIFGIPGVQLDWAVEAIAQQGDRLRLVVPRHEQTTTYMADGYARSSGRIGVAMTVPGPGMLNAMSGLATAYACSSPVLAIIGQIHSSAVGHRYGLLHEINHQSATLGSVTKWTACAMSPAAIPGIVRKAVDTLRSGRPRPVGIEIPHDVLSTTAEVALIDPPARFDGRLLPASDRVDAAAALLAKARFPVIYAGGGAIAADAGPAIQRLAQCLQAPVVMSESGRGALSDHHPLALTTLGGRVVMRHADVVVVVGSRFMNRMSVTPAWSVTQPQYVFINVEPYDAGPPRKVDVFVHADAQLGVAAIADALGRTAFAKTAREAPRLQAVRDWADRQLDEIGPQRAYASALRQAIPEDGILVSELTQVGYFAGVGYPVYHPRTLLTPGYQGTLGYGFPTGLGVAAACPGRAVVSINGDGGFGWGMQELATARKYNLGLVTVVFNDGHFGNVKLLQSMTFGRNVGVDLHNPDFQLLARAFDVRSEVTQTPEELGMAIARALAAGGPTLIEARVGAMPNAWHLFRLSSPFPRPNAEPDHPCLA